MAFTCLAPDPHIFVLRNGLFVDCLPLNPNCVNGTDLLAGPTEHTLVKVELDLVTIFLDGTEVTDLGAQHAASACISIIM